MRSWRELHDDEEGASMVFAAITFLTLGVSIMFVFQVSLASTDRIQMQNAADAAAYSGALVEANSLNAIGQVNDAMTYIHYTLLRYTIDSIVYRTLEEYEQHQRWSGMTRRPDKPGLAATWDLRELGLLPPRVPEEVKIGDARRWAEQFRQVQNNEGLIDQGIGWLDDLHATERLIVEATPRLVREAVIDIARRNGAHHVAISADYERAWQIGDRGSGAGFIELARAGASIGDDQPAPQSVWRYAVEVLEVDGRVRDHPTWFDPFRGTNFRPYSQARVCWDALDWAHGQRSVHLNYPGDPRAPNGHWHCRHGHPVQHPETGVPGLAIHGGLNTGIPNEVQTLTGMGGGHQSDDTLVHTLPAVAGGAFATWLHTDPSTVMTDHAIIACPTCNGEQATTVDKTGPRAQHGTIVVNSDITDAEFTHSPRRDKTQRFVLRFTNMPRPLGITAEMLRSGVTVAVQRPGFGLGELLPESPWGTLAVASAQIGLIDGNDPSGGSVLLLSEVGDTATYAGLEDLTSGAIEDRTFEFREQESASQGSGSGRPAAPRFAAGANNYRNLFYHHDFSRGLRFGARLVPVARELTWHSDLAGGVGLDAILGETIEDGRWFSAANPTSPVEETPEIGELPGFLTVNGQNSLEEAMWH